MGGIFQVVFGRVIGRFIGMNIRYLFFRLKGKKISYGDLTTHVINKDNDYDEKGLQQDTYNVLVGVLTIILAILIIKFFTDF